MLRRAGVVSRRAALACWTVAAWSLVASCQRETRPPSLSGLVVDVQSASFTQVSSFRLRTDGGDEHELIVEGTIGFTPSHMREHMLLGQRVVVSVKYADGLEIATLVEDASD